MSIISNHHRSRCHTNVFHLELCRGMFKEISDIMAHLYAINTIIFVISVMHRKVIVHCFSKGIIKEENVLVFYYT